LKRSSLDTNTHQWQTVPCRNKATPNNRRYSESFIPTARSNYFNNLSAEGTAKDRMRQASAKSYQALMDATIMYQKRNGQNHGGAVAHVYAERVCMIGFLTLSVV
jgi:hypothetical protein